MYLGPHHFQAQNRFLEDSVHFATSSLWFANYGLIGFELDAEALGNGTISVINARGIFRDGLPFHMPECDALPATRNITDLFPPTRDTLTILLAIPARQAEGQNTALDSPEGDGVRFTAHPQLFSDENTGRDEREVRMGRKNIRLLLDTELDAGQSGGMLTLPVARIMRDGRGHFVPDPRFIPPSLKISASERLMMLTHRLIEI